MKSMIRSKPHGNIFRQIYLYAVLRIECAKLRRENRRLCRELDKLRSILSERKEEF